MPTSKRQPDGTLIKGLGARLAWQRMLDDGVYATVSEIDDSENISKSSVSRILRLALLAPDIIEAILEGRTAQALMLERLERPLRRAGRSSGEAWGSAVRTIADDRLGCFRRCTCAPPAN